MRKLFFGLVLAALIFATPNITLAIATGSGAFELIVPTDLRTNSANPSFSVYEYNSTMGEYVQEGRDSSSVVIGDSFATGTWDPSTLSGSYNFRASSPSIDFTYADSSVDFYGRFSFTGTINNNFGYDYTYSGYKDDPAARLGFISQMEIYYLGDADGDGDSNDRIYVLGYALNSTTYYILWSAV